MKNILETNINSIAVLIFFESKYKINIKDILNWNMKCIIHCTWGSQLLEKRLCLFANANDACLYELIATEMKNAYPCFTFADKSRSHIAIFDAMSPLISNIYFLL